MHNVKKICLFFATLNPFQEVWAWFFIAATVFVAGLCFALPIGPVIFIYQGLFISFLLAAAAFCYKNRRLWRAPFFITSTIIFIWFLIKGVYLEYPGDPWEFFRLIAEWQNKINFSEFPHRYGRFWLDPPRFAYLFYWAQIHDLPRTSWRAALTVISASTITLVFVQIYNLAKEFQEKNHRILWLTLFGFVFTGICNINYYYYLAIGANALSFIFFYRSLLALIHFVQGKKREFWIVPPIFLMMFFTHAQGLVWYVLVVLCYALYWLTSEKRSIGVRWTLWIAAGFVCLASIVMWYKFHDFYLAYYPQTRSTMDTLGGSGIIALIIGFFYRKKMPLLWSLNFLPLLLVFIPFFVYPTFKYVIPLYEYGHRLLYLVPTGFIVYRVIVYLIENRSWSFKKEMLITTLLFVGLSFDAKRPWFGRLQHVVRPVADELTLKNLEPMVMWLQDNRPQIKNCPLGTDQVTYFLLTTYFAWPLDIDRVVDMKDEMEIDFESAQAGETSCGLLLRDWTKPHIYPRSNVNNNLHHWWEEIVQPDLATSENMKFIATDLLSKGWHKTELPADYILFEKDN